MYLLEYPLLYILRTGDFTGICATQLVVLLFLEIYMCLLILWVGAMHTCVQLSSEAGGVWFPWSWIVPLWADWCGLRELNSGPLQAQVGTSPALSIVSDNWVVCFILLLPRNPCPGQQKNHMGSLRSWVQFSKGGFQELYNGPRESEFQNLDPSLISSIAFVDTVLERCKSIVKF